VGELDRHRAPWIARKSLFPHLHRRKIPRIHRPHLPGKASRSRHRSRKAHQDYFDAKIKGLLDHSLVEYIGEIGEHEKEEFLGNASALLFLIDWQEPFGLVLTESMACGTPIIGYGMGSVPEVIDEGITGHIVHNMDDAANAATRIDALDRRTIRRVFEKRFTASRMCHDYLNIYQRIRDGEPYLSEGELRSSTV
jgi:glycosyltransferase involved in cell wall biosynthesis